MGWVKSESEPCNPVLGEAWRLGDELSPKHSVTLYFTPQIGNISGVLSGINVDYFGYVEEALVCAYISKVRTTSDGTTYHSLAVALRSSSSSEDLCDSTHPAESGNPAYVVIAPDMAHNIIPVSEKDPELEQNWHEGSFLPTMGCHWFQDVVNGRDFSYKSENVVSVVPMYSSRDGTLNGIFFFFHDPNAVPKSKQQWKKQPDPLGCISRSAGKNAR